MCISIIVAALPSIPVLRPCCTVQNAGKHKRNMCRFTPITLTFTKVHLHRLQDKTLPESFTAKNITLRMINLCQKIYFRLPWGLIGQNKLSTSFRWNIMNNWKAAYKLLPVHNNVHLDLAFNNVKPKNSVKN